MDAFPEHALPQQHVLGLIKHFRRRNFVATAPCCSPRSTLLHRCNLSPCSPCPSVDARHHNLELPAFHCLSFVLFFFVGSMAEHPSCRADFSVVPLNQFGSHVCCDNFFSIFTVHFVPLTTTSYWLGKLHGPRQGFLSLVWRARCHFSPNLCASCGNDPRNPLGLSACS